MDKISAPRRSANMRAIRSSNTKPELRVRAQLRSLGLTGYRLHRKDLAGRPDIVFIGRKKAIFVHGCFWHGHDCPEGRRRPSSRPDYWLPKISGNQARDARHAETLRVAGWDVLVVWECGDFGEDLARSLNEFVLSPRGAHPASTGLPGSDPGAVQIPKIDGPDGAEGPL